jgi:ankyrin repeat protein
MNHPPQNDDQIIPQFRPVNGQWELNDENIKRVDARGENTILHNYCQYINTTPIEVFKYLIETKHCNVHSFDYHLNTPLHFALHSFDPGKGGDVSILTYLLNQKGVDLDIRGQYGFTLFHLACHKINTLPLDIFKLLVKLKEENGNTLQDDELLTSINDAFRNFKPTQGENEANLMYLLNQKSLNVNTENKYGFSVLSLACNNINTLPLGVFKVLVENKGADVNLLDRYENTPLCYALSNVEPNQGENAAILTYLLSQTVIDVNIKNNSSNNTLLHRACENINSIPVNIFKSLIEVHGADVNVEDGDKNTPIHIAFCNFAPNYGDINVLAYLLAKNNFDTNITDPNGCTLLHLALHQGIDTETEEDLDSFCSQMVESIIQRRSSDLFFCQNAKKSFMLSKKITN